MSEKLSFEFHTSDPIVLFLIFCYLKKSIKKKILLVLYFCFIFSNPYHYFHNPSISVSPLKFSAGYYFASKCSPCHDQYPYIKSHRNPAKILMRSLWSKLRNLRKNQNKQKTFRRLAPLSCSFVRASTIDCSERTEFCASKWNSSSDFKISTTPFDISKTRIYNGTLSIWTRFVFSFIKMISVF